MTKEEFDNLFQKACDHDATCQALIKQCANGKMTLKELETELIKEVKAYWPEDAMELEWNIEHIKSICSEENPNLVNGSGSFMYFFETDEESFGFAVGYFE